MCSKMIRKFMAKKPIARVKAEGPKASFHQRKRSTPKESIQCIVVPFERFKGKSYAQVFDGEEVFQVTLLDELIV